MLKRITVLFISFIFYGMSCAAEPFRGGVSFDYEKIQNKKVTEIQSRLPVLEKDFIDLNYSIDFKPLSLLSEEDLKIKKPSAKPRFSSPKVTPDEYEVSFSTGKLKGYTNSSSKIEALIKNNPDNRDLLFAYAIQLKNEGKLNEALNTVNKAIELDSDNALSHFLKGDILRNMEMFKEAVNEYIYTTQLNPLCADAYYNIALILELLDNPSLALDYYTTAYQINPNDSEIRDIILKHYIDL